MEKYVIVKGNKRRKTTDMDKSSEGPEGEEHTSAAVGDQAFVLRELTGDLFASPSSESLAHCISEDCHMGKGIAVLFKRKFGGVSDLLEQNPTTGGVCVLCRNSRFVYYLITKKKYWNKPTYVSLTASLTAMREEAVANQVTAISMPRIGCGLDGLQWDKVKHILHEVFSKTSIVITVYTLEQTGSYHNAGRGRGREKPHV